MTNRASNTELCTHEDLDNSNGTRRQFRATSDKMWGRIERRRAPSVTWVPSLFFPELTIFPHFLIFGLLFLDPVINIEAKRFILQLHANKTSLNLLVHRFARLLLACHFHRCVEYPRWINMSSTSEAACRERFGINHVCIHAIVHLDMCCLSDMVIAQNNCQQSSSLCWDILFDLYYFSWLTELSMGLVSWWATHRARERES